MADACPNPANRMKKVMRKYLLTVIVSFFVLAPSYGFCSNILGIVNDPQGNPVNGCHINVTDSTGKVLRDARTDLYGRYCIPAVDPGTYTLVLDPKDTGVQTGSGPIDLQLEGLTVDWKAAKDKAAVPASTPGVASRAAATCAPWWDNAGVGATAFAVTGGGIVGILCGTGVICGGGGGSGPAASSASQ
jgi:hypothetical protein